MQYWLPINYSTSGTRSKSSCSPDLGIESDAAVSITRPLKNTLKITESMTNLLSDDDSGHGNRRERDTESESPLPIEGMCKHALKCKIVLQKLFYILLCVFIFARSFTSY